MNISKTHAKELNDKQEFVKEISKTFQRFGRYHSVEKIYYDVFEANDCLEEYVVVQFVGGAIAVANSAANSLTAITRLIGKLIDGGYYEEERVYNLKCGVRKEIEVA